MVSRDIRRPPNERFLEKLAAFDEGNSRGQDEGMYTDPTNMTAEGLTGAKGWNGTDATWDAKVRKGPISEELERDGDETGEERSMTQGRPVNLNSGSSYGH
jgi:hypothetical protein